MHFLHIDNSKKPVAFYSLDVILAVGFRVRSPRGTQFRRWANTTLKEYLQKGFVIDDERLKNPDGRPNYFDELLARIRSSIENSLCTAKQLAKTKYTPKKYRNE